MTGYVNPFSNRKHYYEHIEWLHDHISGFFEDDSSFVFHEIPALDLRIDVFLIKPNTTKFNILLTAGMSTLKMKVDDPVDNINEVEFAEIMMLVPKSITFQEVYTGENKNDWIISILKQTAKFPHFNNTWIGIGHTIQAEEDMTPYSLETDFVGALILPSVTFDKAFTEINKDGRKINIYSIFPLYKDELEYKITNGYNKLLDLLIQANSKEVLNLKRNSLLKKKSFWDKITGK